MTIKRMKSEDVTALAKAAQDDATRILEANWDESIGRIPVRTWEQGHS